MDAEVIETPGLLEQNPWVRRRKLSVDDYYRMADAGILGAREPVELIEGELVEMAPAGSDHGGTSNWLLHRLGRALGERAIVSRQNPLRLSDYTEPEPDFLLVKPRADFYRKAHPVPADVLLAIEVSNSSLRYDRTVKRALYARHGIVEFWIVDLAGKAMEVSTGPGADGYATTIRVEGDQTLRPTLLPDIELRLADLFFAL